MTIEALKRSAPGEWLEMDFGFDREVFYVIERTPDGLTLGNRSWLASRTLFYNFTTLAEKRPLLLGVTSQRWWWRFLPWRDLVCPFRKLK